MNLQSTVQSQLSFWHPVLDGMVAECGQDVIAKNLPDATITSIGSIYAHIVMGEDFIVNGMLQGKPAIYESGGYKAKIGISFDGRPSLDQEWARKVVLDFPQFQEYAKAVYANTGAYLAGVPDTDLERKVQTPAGEQSVGWVLATIMATHCPQHTGEIAALKGVQGMKGLPF